MSKELTCAARCGAAPVIVKPVPLCVLHGLEVASEIVPGVLKGTVGKARQDAAANRSPAHLAAVAAPPGTADLPDGPARPTREEAHRLAAQRLDALRAQGLEWVAVRHFRDVPALAGRSRPWMYMWLQARVDDGVLVPDPRGGQAGYRFAA